MSRKLINVALEMMKEDFPRASVYGLARYDKDGYPIEIVVETLERMPGFGDMTNPQDVQGIDITGGIDSVDYIRSLRDAD